MVLTTPKRIKEIDLRAMRRQATVSVSGYFYAVDLGPDVQPQQHRVGKDRRCTCGLGTDCPAVQAVADYLKAGGERTPDPPAGFYPVAPQACPICSAGTYYVPEFNSKRRGAGWACDKGNRAHYWEAHIRVLRENLAKNPWIFPPVIAPGGRILYSGLKREDLITESLPWPDGYNPNL